MWCTLVVVLFAALLYAPTLRYGLVWDDPISIFRWLPALSNWKLLFCPPGGIPQFPPDYYRPLQLLSYKVDFALGGGQPWAFHFSSVVWHAIATALVIRTTRELLGNTCQSRFGSIVAGIVFAVHPIHTESVAWIAARVDPMVTAFLLGALVALRASARNQVRHWCFAAVLTFAALLTKEVAIAAIVLLPAWLWATAESKTRESVQGKREVLWAIAICGLVVAAYILLRIHGLAHYSGTPVVVPSHLVSTLLAAFGWYAVKLFWPFPQNAFVARVPLDTVYVAIGTAVVAGSMYVGLRAARTRARPALFCLLWYWSTLAPALMLVAKPPSAPLAERYLYVPSVAFAWASGWIASRAQQIFSASAVGKLAFQVSAAIVALCLATATVRRNEVWRDNFALWSDTAKKTTNDGFALRNLAAAHLEAGQTERARELLLQALNLPNTPQGMSSIHSNLGTIAFYAQDWEAAQTHYSRADELQPTGDVAFNLGVTFLRQSDFAPDPQRQLLLQRAITWLHVAEQASPNDSDIQFACAESLRLLGQLDEAQKHYRRALQLGLPRDKAEHARRYLRDALP